MPSIRDIRQAARTRIHETLRVAAWFVPPTGDPFIVGVRVQTHFGDKGISGGMAQQQLESPIVHVLASQKGIMTGGHFVLSDSEVYRVVKINNSDGFLRPIETTNVGLAEIRSRGLDQYVTTAADDASLT